MSEIQFVDTTLRDGVQSLWAMNMRTGAMLKVVEQVDQAGFESLEFFAPTMFKKFVRDLQENPWYWISEGTKRIKHTRIRMVGGIHGVLEKTPLCLVRLLVERLCSYGIKLTRTSDSWNDYESLTEGMEFLKKSGVDLVLNVIYSVSPRHTDEYYARKTREAAATKPWRLCLKDVGGLLTPERARTLIPIILHNAGDIPVEFHAHCSNGQAPLCYLEGVKLGMKILHTAIPPLANGNSLPSVFNVAKNLSLLGYATSIDLRPLADVERDLNAVARREGFPVGRPVEYDHYQYLHQVPGGMISNMHHQLKLVGMEHKMRAALEETIQVRADLGCPIMITPLAQFVGTQAAINVMVGERYKVVPDQIIQYALGYWGKEAPAVMDQDVKEKILNRPQAREWANWERPEPSLQEVRKQFGTHLSDEDLLLRFDAGQDNVNALPNDGRPREYLDAAKPLVSIIEKLAKQKETSRVYFQGLGFSVQMSNVSWDGCK